MQSVHFLAGGWRFSPIVEEAGGEVLPLDGC